MMQHSPSINEGSESCSFQCCLSPILGSPRRSLVQNHTTNQSTADVSGTFQYDFATITASSLYPHTEFSNHESLPQLQESFRNFVRAYPQYLNTVEADHIREQDYYHLSLFNQVCLDYFGHGLFSYNQQQHQVPESAASTSAASSSTSPPPLRHPTLLPFFEIAYKPVMTSLRSQLMNSQETEFEARLRTRITQFLSKSEDDYSMVFTANQSASFKLLADSYPFEKNRTLLTVYDHRNEAVEAMIESSKRRAARVYCSQFKWPKMKIHHEKLKEMIVKKNKKKVKRGGLFVFPLQSRVTGAQYSYQWMNIAQEHGWHVLLDANALGPKDMDTMGLCLFRPDFLICTFYKVFGANPSGFSCLFVKKCHFSTLKDTATAEGRGIVNLVPIPNYTSQLSDHLAPNELMEDIKQRSEIGRENEELPVLSSAVLQTPDRHSNLQHNAESSSNNKQKQPMHSEIEEIEDAGLYSTMEQEDVDTSSNIKCSETKCKGLDHADSMGRILISIRTRYLINWLVNALLSLRYPKFSENGHHLITIYGPKIRFDRASILAFNVFDWKGERIDPILIQKLAGRNNISLSVEFITNISFRDRYDQEENNKLLEKRLIWKGGRNNGSKKKRETFVYGISVATVSIGFLNNFEDVYKFWAFVSRFLDADFVEKEKWRYSALNQKTVEI